MTQPIKNNRICAFPRNKARSHVNMLDQIDGLFPSLTQPPTKCERNLFENARQRISEARGRVDETFEAVRELLVDFPDEVDLPEELTQIPKDRMVQILEYAGYFVDSAEPKLALTKILLDVVYKQGVFNDFRWRSFYCTRSRYTGHKNQPSVKWLAKDETTVESQHTATLIIDLSEWNSVDSQSKKFEIPCIAIHDELRRGSSANISSRNN